MTAGSRIMAALLEQKMQEMRLRDGVRSIAVKKNTRGGEILTAVQSKRRRTRR